MIVIPFLAVATARNTGWTVDLHLSRGAVFHSTALLVSGAFLLPVAGAGYFVRYLRRRLGPGAADRSCCSPRLLLVVLVATSGRFRSKLKVFVSKHFFSYRYDYREEWLRFTRTLSTESPMQDLQERTIMALADLVESPAGALWLRDEARGFVAGGALEHAARSTAPSAPTAPLAAFPRANAAGSSASRSCARDPARYAGLALPAWLSTRFRRRGSSFRCASGAELLGFVVLMTPRTTIESTGRSAIC